MNRPSHNGPAVAAALKYKGKKVEAFDVHRIAVPDTSVLGHVRVRLGRSVFIVKVLKSHDSGGFWLTPPNVSIDDRWQKSYELTEELWSQVHDAAREAWKRQEDADQTSF